MIMTLLKMEMEISAVLIFRDEGLLQAFSNLSSIYMTFLPAFYWPEIL